MSWSNDGPDKEEWAGDEGERREAARRGDDEFDRTGSYRDRIPYTSAEYQRLEGRFYEW